MNNETYKPTTRLRFVERKIPIPSSVMGQPATAIRNILQQWWGPNAPAYMHDETQGEWRDVEVVTE